MDIDAANALGGASLAALKRDATGRPNDDSTLRKVAQQFEALLAQQVLKAARASSLGDDLMGGSGVDLYKDIFDQQMAQQMSSGKGLGLADVLVQQLRGTRVTGPVLDQSLDEPFDNLAANGPLPVPFVASLSNRAREPSAAAVAKASAPVTDRITDFVNTIWHQAERAAKALGLPTEAVVGHAALETGWGAHRPGSDSNNLFGIKTGARWQGDKVRASTTEMDGGRTRTEQADFRSYDSADQGFADYVRFLKTNPRYAEAIKAGSTPQQFAEGLQKAGYATDPHYASKLKAAIARAAQARPAI